MPRCLLLTRSGVAYGCPKTELRGQDRWLTIHSLHVFAHYSFTKGLLDFLFHAYLNSATSISEEVAHTTMFKIFITDIEYVVADRTVDDKESAYIFGCLLPSIESYFSEFAKKAKSSDDQVTHDSPTTRLTIRSLRIRWRWPTRY